MTSNFVASQWIPKAVSGEGLLLLLMQSVLCNSGSCRAQVLLCLGVGSV
jgi:hypothetical protein